ncbi:ATP-binding cassette domain-containing protein [Micromonospora sp. NPDC048830]|uniref:ATP-binding cassette domain-containing protein n=1 Tax=Micromonospora sp. NPDC048830 TaxID=3364257 RepID=UPI00371B380B
MLEVKGVGFRYGARSVLADVSLQFATGANLLLGRNGAGKTTLLRILAGAMAPTAGTVLLNGQLSGGSTRLGRRLLGNIGWLPQDFGYPPRMTVREFAAYAAWLKAAPPKTIPQKVDFALQVVDLGDRAGCSLGSLSGGQLRRAGLAAALAGDPAVLILDEPTAGLDPEQRDTFHQLVQRLKEHKTVIVATHLLEDVEALAGRVVIIDQGAVRWSGSLPELSLLGGEDSNLAALRTAFHKVVSGAS